MRRGLLLITLIPVLGAPVWASGPEFSLDDLTRSGRTTETAYVPAQERALSLENPHWQRFVSEQGAGWFVSIWSRDSDRPAFAMGPGIDLGLSRSPDRSAVIWAALRFVSESPGLFGVNAEDLSVDTFNEDGRRRFVLFRQTVDGVPVLHGRIHMSFADGKLVAFGSSAQSDVDIVTAPATSPDAAARAAVASLGWSSEMDLVKANRLIILPVTRSGGTNAFFLAYEIVLETEDPPSRWRVYIDAASGGELVRIDELEQGTFSGSVKGDIQPLFYSDPYTEAPFDDIRVEIDGGDLVYTDEQGEFAGFGPDAPSMITVPLWGRYVLVEDFAEGDAVDEISVVAEPGVPVSLVFDDTNTHVAERNCYRHVNIAHDWLKRLDPDFTGMDQVLTCSVNTTNCCDAIYAGIIAFSEACEICVNMAQVIDLIYHEYQHGINWETYAPDPSPIDSGMSEAFADYCGMTLTDTPFIGEEAYLNGAFFRTGENLRQYPGTECNGEVHCLGEPLMGALWKARVSFQAKYGTEAGTDSLDHLFRRTQKSKKYTIPAFLSQLLVEDDDNADLADGTPNYAEICDAFAMHNLPCPAPEIYVDIVHDPISDTADTTGAHVVTAEISSIGAGSIGPEGARVLYTTDGIDYVAVPMTPSPIPTPADLYSGSIPPQPGGTLIDYYIEVVTEDGIEATHPPQAPWNAVHRFLVGATVEKLAGGLEDNKGWIEGAEDDDATDGFWEWGDPIGKTHPTEGDTIQPEFDHTQAGTNCYVTRNVSEGNWLNGNVDFGKVTLFSPVMDFTDVAGAGYVELWFFMVDWLFQVNHHPDDFIIEIGSDASGWQRLATISSPNWTEFGTWTRRKIYFRDTDFVFDEAVRMRFIAEDVPREAVLEVAIDDVVVKVCPKSSSSVGPANSLPGVFLVRGSRPNPFSPSTVIRYQLPSRMRVRAEVFNVAGKRVRVLMDETQDGGAYDVLFDGRNQEGKPLPSGVYFTRIEAGGEKRTLSMTLVR